MRKNERGSIAILQFALAAIVLFCELLFFGMGFSAQQKTYTETQDAYTAEIYASELLETFRAWKGQWLWNYLKTNPVDTRFGAYPLCTRINLLDRASGKIVNEDPVAQLPPANALDLGTKNANRFYQVHVVDKTTLQPKSALCSKTAVTGTFDAATDRLLVTVGVSWIPKTQTQPKRIVLATILPE